MIINIQLCRPIPNIEYQIQYNRGILHAVCILNVYEWYAYRTQCETLHAHACTRVLAAVGVCDTYANDV